MVARLVTYVAGRTLPKPEEKKEDVRPIIKNPNLALAADFVPLVQYGMSGHRTRLLNKYNKLIEQKGREALHKQKSASFRKNLSKKQMAALAAGTIATGVGTSLLGRYHGKKRFQEGKPYRSYAVLDLLAGPFHFYREGKKQGYLTEAAKAMPQEENQKRKIKRNKIAL